MQQVRCGMKTLDLSRPVIMGILNVTPDSFSDGGKLYRDGQVNLPQVLSRARQMVHDGAAIIDVGGESTRPGAAPVPVDVELERVVPVVEALAKELDVIISVDTSSPKVIYEAATVGAGLINDVRSLRRPGAVQAVLDVGLPVCIMHMLGEPETMQNDPQYTDIVDEVKSFLAARAQELVRAGVARDKIIIDPGYGFAKTTAHNLMLLRGQDNLLELGYPILAGLSRKSMLKQLLGRDVDRRLAGSLGLALAAVAQGASILRVHDVAETRDVLLLNTLLAAGS